MTPGMCLGRCPQCSAPPSDPSAPAGQATHAAAGPSGVAPQGPDNGHGGAMPHFGCHSGQPGMRPIPGFAYPSGGNGKAPMPVNAAAWAAEQERLFREAAEHERQRTAGFTSAAQHMNTQHARAQQVQQMQAAQRGAATAQHAAAQPRMPANGSAAPRAAPKRKAPATAAEAAGRAEAERYARGAGPPGGVHPGARGPRPQPAAAGPGQGFPPKARRRPLGLRDSTTLTDAGGHFLGTFSALSRHFLGR